MRTVRLILAAMLAAVLVPAGAAAAAPARPAPGIASTPTVRDLGPASEVTSTGVAEPVGDLLWTATSGVSPVRVGGYDATTHEVTDQVSLPTGDGVWAMTHIGTDLYIGTYTPGDLYRLDTTTGTLTKVANFGSFIWSLAASPDGKIFGGTYPDGAVREYDPATGATTDLGTVVAGEQYVRSIAADATTVYAGVGSHAHLVAIDRATGTKTEILPAAYRTATFAATMALSGHTLAVSLSPLGTMLVYDTADLAHPTAVRPNDTDQYVTAITLADDAIYLGMRPSGTIYRYTAAGGAESLGAPYDGAYVNRFVLDGGVLRAELTSAVVDLDLGTGTFTGHDLVAAGLPPTPELAMQLTATAEGTVLVSGKVGIQVHDLATGASTRTFLTGEAKTMTEVDGTVHLGVYTLARLYTIGPDGTGLRQVGDVGNEQTRPTDAHYDPATGQLLVTTEADYGRLNGALALYSVRTGRLDVHRGVVPNQSIRSVTSRAGVAYLGSETRNSLGTDPIVRNATVSAYDLRTGAVRWQVTPVEGAQQVSSLVAWGDRLYGTTDTGVLFTLDARTGALLGQVTVGTGQSVLTRAGTGLYGTDGHRVFRVRPGDAPRVATVVDGLAAEFYSVPMLAAGPDGHWLYTLRGRNLVGIAV
ncbi:MAG TPA: PQQ-binding-like beta-propeller repeat protein [Actinocatenispora sp.]